MEEDSLVRIRCSPRFGFICRIFSEPGTHMMLPELSGPLSQALIDAASTEWAIPRSSPCTIRSFASRRNRVAQLACVAFLEGPNTTRLLTFLRKVPVPAPVTSSSLQAPPIDSRLKVTTSETIITIRLQAVMQYILSFAIIPISRSGAGHGCSNSF